MLRWSDSPASDILSLSEGFGEDVCNLLKIEKHPHSILALYIDDLLLNQITEKMHVYLNVFGPLMMNHVLRDLDGALVVIIYD
jgi:hypothetical protein